MDLNSLNIEKMRVVEVVTTRPDISFQNTAYDDGGELYKVENGMVWVKHMSFVVHPRESFKSEWKRVLPEREADKVVIKNWIDKKILDEYSIRKL